ncbi:hypothetical protein WKW50_23680 [Ochrobactrum sp. GPK 3]
MGNYLKYFSFISIGLFSLPALSEEVKSNDAIIIDDFRPKTRRFSLSFGADYGYYTNKSLSLSFVKAGSLGVGEVILPLSVDQGTKKHVATFSLGASTSLTESLTVRAKIRGRASKSAVTHYGIETESDTDFRAGEISVGASYNIAGFSKWPSLTAFADYSALQNNDGHLRIGRSFSIGASASILDDPLLYSFSLAYARIGGDEYTKFQNLDGNFLIFSPSLGFAVNDLTTLSGGMSAAIAATKENSPHSNQDFSAMAFFGVAHKLSNDRLLNVNFRHGLADDNSFGVGTDITQRF